MTEYGKGSILGAATVLPATSGIGLLLANNANPVIVEGLLIISSISLLVLIGSISRYIVNRIRNK